MIKNQRMLKSTFLLFILLFFCSLLCAADAKTESLCPPDIRAIKERGKLKVIQFTGKRQGFFMYDEKNEFPDNKTFMVGEKRLIGYDIELAYHIAERLGVEVEISKAAKSFTNACQMVAKGEADIAISKMTITPARGQYVRFTRPYVTLKLGVLINRLLEVKAQRGQNPLDICNHKDAIIAVEKGSAWEHYVPDLFPEAQILLCKNMMAAVDAVKKGDALATLNDEWNIGTVLRKNPSMSLRVRLSFIPDMHTNLAMAVNPSSPNLLAYLDLLIEKDRLVTTPDILMDRFFPKGTVSLEATIGMAESVTSDKKGDYKVIGVIVGILLVAVMLYFTLSRKKNA